MTERRMLGASDLEVSVLGLGCNNFGKRLDQRHATDVVSAALEVGINFFDTANSYSAGVSETYLGHALRGRRDQAIVATKFGGPQAPEGGGASTETVIRCCEASLRRLGTDYIDLYYVHFPDPAVPIAETLSVLHELVRSGKVRHIACSNFAAWQIGEAMATATERALTPFVAVQSEWSLLERGIEHAVLPAAEHFGLGVIPYFPLASGVLTGKYRRGEAPPADSRAATWAYFSDIASDDRLRRAERLQAFATEQDRSLLELALGWVAAQPAVASVLTGATSPAQVGANAAAIAWRLTPEDLRAVGSVDSVGEPMPATQIG